MQNKWEQMAAESNLRVFPVLIEKAGNKWVKKPLIKNWQDRANYYKLTDFDWSRANGFGILMGMGTYGLDLDLYKDGNAAEEWFDQHRVTRDTRTHRTVSGGLHRIYMIPADLPTRANIVPGLDGRGVGGFLAFGEGYELVQDKEYPAWLSREAREDIARSSPDVVNVSGVQALVDGWSAPEPNGAERRLNHALLYGPRMLGERWKGNTSGLNDRSRSAMDHSVAKLMAIAGLEEDVIVWAVLTRFDHGAARWKPSARVSIRAAARSALKGTQDVAETRKRIDYFKQPEMTASQEEAMNAALREKEG